MIMSLKPVAGSVNFFQFSPSSVVTFILLPIAYSSLPFVTNFFAPIPAVFNCQFAPLFVDVRTHPAATQKSVLLQIPNALTVPPSGKFAYFHCALIVKEDKRKKRMCNFFMRSIIELNQI